METRRIPVFAFLGDTTHKAFDADVNPTLLNYPCVITECTFLYPEHEEDAATRKKRHNAPRRMAKLEDLIAEADAAIAAVDDDMAAAKKKLQSLSYGAKGQDPKKLFSHYDRDNSGHLDFNEFRNAVRRGGHLTPSMLSDGDLRKLFSAVDDDSSGDVSIDELTAFVWGETAADAAPSSPPQPPPGDQTADSPALLQRPEGLASLLSEHVDGPSAYG